MVDSYKILYKGGSGELVEKKSRFIADLCPVSSEEEALDFIEEIRKKYIFESRDQGISRSYIFGYEKDNPSYEYLRYKIFEEIGAGTIQETFYTAYPEQEKLLRLLAMKPFLLHQVP